MMYSHDKILALKMRKKGKTYTQILTTIPDLAKSTLSDWFKKERLNENELEKITTNQRQRTANARLAAARTNIRKRQYREKLIKKESITEFYQFVSNPLFIAGLVMYWAEGGKRSRSVELINSDVNALKLIINWFEKFLGILPENMKFRLYTHKPFRNDGLEKIWANALEIVPSQFQSTVYKNTTSNYKKRENYIGCLRVRVGSTNKLRKILNWHAELIKYLKL